LRGFRPHAVVKIFKLLGLLQRDPSEAPQDRRVIEAVEKNRIEPFVETADDLATTARIGLRRSIPTSMRPAVGWFQFLAIPK
jgi:hypothetical protein